MFQLQIHLMEIQMTTIRQRHTERIIITFLSVMAFAYAMYAIVQLRMENEALKAHAQQQQLELARCHGSEEM